MTNIPWKIGSSHTTQLDRFKVTIDEVVLANQTTKNFSYIHFSDGVCVLALTPNEEVLVLKQYRHAVRSWEMELPAGMIDEEEEPLEAAKRELLEETGYDTNEWKSLGFFFPSPGSTTERIHLFLATNVQQIQAPELDELEQIELLTLSLDTFNKNIYQGNFNHGAGLACWAKYLSLKRSN
ncbi:NUDIX hydrolase [Gracilibacillus marinus]|uniref:NUDIX hydrolase n=1 Tax=Gracilibacillus marinus TaxID=630535 RepID=A0ABV8VS04_9BACI